MTESSTPEQPQESDEAPSESITPAPPRRPPAKPWQPGQSGNPGGKPKSLVQVQRLARSYATEAIETLAKLMRTSRSPKVRVAAAQALLDRAYGKPPVAVAIAELPKRPFGFTITFPDGGPGQHGEIADRPRLAYEHGLDDEIEVSGPGGADLEDTTPLTLPAPLPAAAPVEPRAAAEREAVIIDQQTETAVPLATWERLGRPEPPLTALGDGMVDSRMLAGQRSRERAAAQQRAANEARIEEERAGRRAAQGIRDQRLLDQEGQP